jgi:hypothetical protein
MAQQKNFPGKGRAKRHNYKIVSKERLLTLIVDVFGVLVIFASTS